MKRAALHSLGCKVNSYETEAMQQMLEQAGYEIVPFHEKADLYVINTCSVTNVADRKSRQMIHRARRQNPDAIVAAAGCYVQTAAAQAQEDGAADIVIGNNCKQDLLELIAECEARRQQAEGRTQEGRPGAGVSRPDTTGMPWSRKVLSGLASGRQVHCKSTRTRGLTMRAPSAKALMLAGAPKVG